jgi:anti-sigma regulatory factor (Ser/Thr protein kinase)
VIQSAITGVHVLIRVDGPDQAGEARRRAMSMARALEFDEVLATRSALVVSECAGNLWKHGGGGEILLRGIGPEANPAIEVLALDKGSGMADVALCLRDGYSTAGSPGTGLGAVDRLSTECEIFSEVGKGTVILARLRKRPERGATRIALGSVSVPKAGEEVCGDGFQFHEETGFATLMVADGLGHGPAAAECAIAAGAAFQEFHSAGPVELLAAIHGALRGTRGAAVAVARLDFELRTIRYAGIGNIAGEVWDASGKHMVSHAGIVGQNLGTVREYTYGWPQDSVVLLYSDGISTHWSLGNYGGLLFRDPSLLAGIIYRDWNRGRDDATILVARERIAP